MGGAEGKKSHQCTHPGCSATFSRPSRLQTHILSHTGDRPFQCNKCDKTFTRNAHLKRHILVNHEGQRTPSHPVDCDQCGGTFANNHSLKKHMKKVHLVKQYSCEECGLNFHKNHMLLSHMTEHTGKLPWVCDQCSESFQYKMYLKRHMRRHRTHPCPECGVTLERWSDLQLHKSSEHLKAPTEVVACDQCNKEFNEGHMLRMHAAIHQETRQVFECPTLFCPRYFYFKRNLAQHIRSYHEGRKYFCSEPGCQAKFFTKQKLLKHLADGHSSTKTVKRVVKGEARKRRKDKGKFKKPMAAVLTGLDVNGRGHLVEELVEGEVRPLDCAESIIKEAATVLQPSSGTSEAEETIVGCKRSSAKEGTFYENSCHPQEDFLGVVTRPTIATKHFSKMWLVPESDTDTDIDVPNNDNNSRSLPPPAVDFSKFLKS